MNRTPRVLAFAGAIGSGKTTLSSAVASALGCSRVSFGDHVRGVASERGMGETREELQALGAEVIAERGWRGFCDDVIRRASWSRSQPLVIDGIRHAEALDALRSLVHPLPVDLLYLEVSPDERERRLRTRGELLSATAPEHSTEVQVTGSLRDSAQMVLQADDDVSCLVEQVLRWMDQA